MKLKISITCKSNGYNIVLNSRSETLNKYIAKVDLRKGKYS